MSDFNKTYLFRMTHIDNVSHMLEYGVTHMSSVNANTSYKPIGDSSIINTRNGIRIFNGKKLGDYIPFYFGVRMPMLYVVQRGHNGVTAIPAKDIVYCVTSIQQILDHNLSFCFSDGHAVDRLSDFYTKDDLPRIDSILDKRAIKAKYWNDETDLDLKRRKEAEFLVETDIPPTAIIGWVVFNEDAKNNLLAMGIPENKIQVKSTYYF